QDADGENSTRINLCGPVVGVRTTDTKAANRIGADGIVESNAESAALRPGDDAIELETLDAAGKVTAVGTERNSAIYVQDRTGVNRRDQSAAVEREVIGLGRDWNCTE